DRLRDERSRRRDKLAQEMQRTGLDASARRRKDGVVRVTGPCIRELVVQRPTQLVTAAKLGFVLSERPIAVASAIPRGVDIEIDVDDERVSQAFTHRRRLDRSCADRKYVIRFTECLQGRPLNFAKRSLTLALEKLI